MAEFNEDHQVRKIIFNTYTDSLNCYISKVSRSDNKVLNHDVLYNMFKLYRGILTDLHLDILNYPDNTYRRKPTKKEEKLFQCSLNKSKNEFPLCGIIKYRNCEFPEYLDDYGMTTFIEVKFDNKTYKQIQTNDVDWDYELDLLLDVEKLLRLSLDEALLAINDNPWFNNID